MADVYVPQRGDRYHLYEDCSGIEYGRSGNAANGWDTYPACMMPIAAAESAGRTLCRSCCARAVAVAA
ncbi:hypothetical protein [Streptomyces meridianus]|uniref:Uncharacterized protein n=1 Tax=Streptomyces meridianus TaxID=2938945 RepID=A0ABT0X8Q4_9ACTN|nr:hypothetical protein [Streptomyces meridianus]MCM2578705.1 hypothetical protein [Streptomyces meridianus]